MCDKRKIDLVYLWVNGQDKKWREKKNLYLKDKNISEASGGNCRYADNDELKYSLRSVEKYLKFINKIYIVTDNQTPNWLNLNNKQIKIIDHSEIIPKKYLPLFNSVALETFIPYIEGLSEYFIYSNDDCFVYKNTKADFFFKNEKPVHRFNVRLKQSHKNHIYGKSLYYTKAIIENKINKKTVPFLPHHNMTGYKKSDCMEYINLFIDEIEKTRMMKFREGCAMEKTGIEYWSVALKKSIYKRVHLGSIDYIFALLRIKQTDSLFLSKNKNNILEKLNLFKPHLFCINDIENADGQNTINLQNILEKLYPEKSCYEI